MKWQQLKQQHWNSRNPREKRALSLAALVVGPIVVYLLLWQPASQATTKLQQTLPKLRTEAAQLQANAREYQQIRQMPQPALQDSQMLISSVMGSAEQLNISGFLNSIEPAGESQVRLQIEQIPFALWIDLLRELQQTHHIRAQSVSIVAQPVVGMVRVNATLTTGGLE